MFKFIKYFLASLSFLSLFPFLEAMPLCATESSETEFSMFKPDAVMTRQVETAIDLVLSCRDRNSAIPRPAELASLLEYMISADGAKDAQYPGDRSGGKGIFWKRHLNMPFASVLRYYFNPGISSELLYPSSIRLGYWLPGSDMLNLSVPLWEQVDEIADSAVILRGEEFEEITPDNFSGSYYRYNQDRLIMLLRYKNLPMLLSVVWQKGASEVGKKGWFLGDYSNWDFVFTRDAGGTATGLGMFSTYMYSSYCISLFFPQGDLRTGYSIFKWLKAGWGGFNVVQARHILSGAERNFAGMKAVTDGGLSAEDLEEIESLVRRSDRGSLLEMSENYARALAVLSKSDDVLKRSEFQNMLNNGDYTRRLNDYELRSLVKINALKRKLGKPVLGN